MFLSRAECKRLVEYLREIPDLIEPLALAYLRQSRRGLDASTTRRPPQSTPPVDVEADQLAEDLHNTLTGWIRVVCDQRALENPGATTLAGAAKWLDKYVISLAMTEGALAAFDDITEGIERVKSRLLMPDVGALTEEELTGANRMILTAYQIDRALPLLGDRGEGLNRRRVEILARAGVLQPCDRDPDTGTKFFRLGDILAAHQIHPRRGTRQRPQLG